MYSISEAYTAAVNANSRIWHVKTGIVTPLESYSLTDAHIEKDSISLEESVMPSDTFSPGAAVMADFKITIVNDNGIYNNVQFNGAKLTPEIGLVTGVVDNVETVEWIPLGIFTVDDVARTHSRVTLLAFDNLHKADKPFSEVPVTYPITAGQLWSDVCGYCMLANATTTFLNDDYVILVAPYDGASCRDVLSWIAQIACSFVRCTRTGLVELAWFKNPEYVTEVGLDGNEATASGGDFEEYNTKQIDGGSFDPPDVDFSTFPATRFDIKLEDDPIVITGVCFETADELLTAGSDVYMVDLSDNPLIQQGFESLLTSLLLRLVEFTYIPFNCSWIGDPAVQAGDLVEHTDRAGIKHRTIVCSSKYLLRGKCSLSAGGISETAQGYKDPTLKKIRQLRDKMNKQIVEASDYLDLAIRNAVGMLGGVWGGYRIYGEDMTPPQPGVMYLSDQPLTNFANAQKLWKHSLGGMGYSDDGGETWNSAWTADGAMFTNLMTANMMRTGMLQSLNGNSWFDLDNGEFAVKTEKLQASLMGAYCEDINGEDYVKTWAQGLGFHGRDINGDPIGNIAEDPENLLGGLFSLWTKYKLGETEYEGGGMMVYGDIGFQGDIFSDGDISAYGELNGGSVTTDNLNARTSQINITIGTNIVGYIDATGFHNGAP